MHPDLPASDPRNAFLGDVLHINGSPLLNPHPLVSDVKRNGPNLQPAKASSGPCAHVSDARAVLGHRMPQQRVPTRRGTPSRCHRQPFHQSQLSGSAVQPSQQQVTLTASSTTSAWGPSTFGPPFPTNAPTTENLTSPPHPLPSGVQFCHSHATLGRIVLGPTCSNPLFRLSRTQSLSRRNGSLDETSPSTHHNLAATQPPIPHMPAS